MTLVSTGQQSGRDHPCLTIGPLTLSSPLALAPMAGVSHSPFRRIILSMGGCGLVSTEMVNAASFSPKALRSHHMLEFQPQEHPIAVQISGHDPDLFARAAVVAQEHGVDLVDINAGCPVPSVTHAGGGAALLRDLNLLESILRAVRRAIRIPLTLKFRSGWTDQAIVAVEVARLAESCGCDAITLHPRTRAQRYNGQADWGLTRTVVEAVSIPVLASGDIWSVADAQRCFHETGCAGILVARGIMRNPWLIAQIATAGQGQEPYQPTLADRYHFLRHYRDLLQAEIPRESVVLGKLKMLVSKLYTGLPNRTSFHRRFMPSKSLAEAWAAIEDYFDPDGVERSSPQGGTGSANKGSCPEVNTGPGH